MKARVRASAIVIHNDRLLVYQDTDTVTGALYHFVPGGEIEPDETAPEAAERETLEETGYQASVDPQSHVEAEYIFTFNGITYDCLTLFYRGHLTKPMQVQASPCTTLWIPLTEISELFAYHPTIRDSILQFCDETVINPRRENK